MVTLTNSNTLGVVEYSCLAKDLKDIYSSTYSNCATGSSLFVVDTREVYFWDNETKKWLGIDRITLQRGDE